ncbi:MAG: ATPase AAA-2 domain-containing protein [Puniceicoccaceae bacterium 5H]|nr:MAG: ATPase AAA-2 domain-containing protein [Puniceicoccaceae bacterium 5H]
MSKDNNKNPLEELQDKLQEAIRSGQVNMDNPFGSGISPQGGSGSSSEDSANSDDDTVLQAIQEFNRKPREIRDYLDRFVVKQQEAKRVLSVAICDHYNHVRQCIENPELLERDYHKQNILLLGPTGVGKTYLMRTAAKLIGVPFVKADATKFSETGYVGSDVEDLVRDLHRASGRNADLAQYGIIYIDEIDKIASASNSQGGGGKDVSGRGVQINLLKLMEDAEVPLTSATDMMGQMQAMMEAQRGGKGKRTISTRHILFIVSGAFDRLSESVKKRLEETPLGFGQPTELVEREDSDYLHRVETKDLIKYGYEPEFVGRLPVRVACDHLRTDDLVQILTSSEGNILEQYRQDFKGYGIDFKITTEALDAIAERGHSEGTGARGLMTVFEKIFREFKFELPSTGIQSFEVTRETVENPHEALKALLRENAHLQRSVLRKELETFAARFEEDHGLKLRFTDEACDVLVDAAVDQDKTIRAICEDRFKDFVHGLKIVARNTQTDQFEISAAMARNPDKELSRLVVESFQNREAVQPEADDADQ